MVERWIVAPKVASSSLVIYPIRKYSNIYIYLQKLFFVKRASVFSPHLYIVSNSLSKMMYLSRLYKLNNLIWQEAFLVDFVSKKIVNKWTQKFLIISSYLFNERLVFEFIVRFGLEFFLYPLQKLSIIELDNIINLFNWLLSFLFLILLIFFTVYFYVCLF